MVTTLAGYSYKSGYYYDTKNSAVDTGNSILQNNGDLQFHPCHITSDITIQSLSINVSTAASATSTVVRLGIYADNGSGSPGSLVLDAGTVQINSTGIKTITVSQSLPKGIYWFAAWNSRVSGTQGNVNFYTSVGVNANNAIGGNTNTFSVSLY